MRSRTLLWVGSCKACHGSSGARSVSTASRGQVSSHFGGSQLLRYPGMHSERIDYGGTLRQGPQILRRESLRLRNFPNTAEMSAWSTLAFMRLGCRAAS